jgi:hypothetical protein
MNTEVCPELVRRFTVRKVVAAAAMLLWLAAVTVPLAYLCAAHLVPFRTGALPAQFLPAPSDGVKKPAWQMIHFLAADCPCSQAVAAHLLQRGPLPGVVEAVALVGRDPALEQLLRARGFAVRLTTEADLARMPRVPAVPSLFIRSPQREMVYAGGYAPRGVVAPAANAEATLLTRLKRGEKIAEYPVNGCAVGRALRAKIDPLQLRYGKSTVSNP